MTNIAVSTPQHDPTSRDEARVRRKARRAGLVLRKSRTRTPEAPDFGLYHLVDPYDNVMFAGGYPFAFSLTLEEAEALLDEHRQVA